MKKITASLLALVLMLTLVSCGGGNDDVRGNVTPSGDNGEKQPEQQEQTSGDDEFDIGTTSGKTYENKFIGIGFTLDDNWTFYTEEQLAELNNFVVDSTSDEFKEMIKNAELVYDVVATTQTGSTMQVILEKANITSMLIDADGYIDASLKNGSIDETEKQLQASGFTDVKAEKSSVTVSGKSIPCIAITAKYGDLDYAQKSLVIKKGSYFANISVSALGSVDDLIAKLYLI